VRGGKHSVLGVKYLFGLAPSILEKIKLKEVYALNAFTEEAMSTFTALKMSHAPLAKQGLKREREQECEEKKAYPIFVGAQKNALIQLRQETWKYRPYLGMDKMYELHAQEDDVVAKAMENGANPFDAVATHWRTSIDLGQKFMMRSLAINKVWVYALELVSAGLMNHEQVKHYIDLASSLHMNSVETSIRRLGHITEEFIKALAEKRPVCMCKEAKCYCLP